MSGGGYRAAAFHLGAMSYLNQCQWQGKNDTVPSNLLDHIKMISTVSGGTITGVVYAITKAEDEPFGDFEKRLTDTLAKVDLEKESLEKLKIGADWGESKRKKNLINAFAEIYHARFTGGLNFNQLTDLIKDHDDCLEVAF